MNNLIAFLRRFLKRQLIGCLIGVCIAIVVMVFVDCFSFLRNIELKTVDLRFKLRQITGSKLVQGAVEERIVIVETDEFTLEKLGRIGQWPLHYHKRIINYINGGGAKAICFCMDLPQSEKAEFSDFLKVVKEAGNVYFAGSLYSSKKVRNFDILGQLERFSLNISKDKVKRIEGKEIFFFPEFELAQASKGIGFVESPLDEDGVLRRVRLFANCRNGIFPFLPLVIACDYLNESKGKIEFTPGKGINLGKFTVPVDKEGRMFINYIGDVHSFRYTSYFNVLNERIPQLFFENKIVLIGSTAAGISRLINTPFSSSCPMPEVLANVIFNLTEGDFLTRPNKFLGIIFGLILGAILGLLAISISPVKLVGIVLTYSLIHSVFCFYLFVAESVWIRMFVPFLIIFLTCSGVWLYRYLIYSTEAIIDELTKVFNRRVFDERLEKELKSSIKNQTPLSLIILDIDNFKRFNDTYGHPVGDKILEAIAFLLKRNVRSKDFIARYGGEEFAIILPKTPVERAQIVGERLRRAVETNIFYDGSNVLPKITISVGVAGYPMNALTKEDLIEAADKALYEAKRNGRNNVMVSNVGVE
jgi:diguanylate cyclase (GGDEF)-like protein